MDLDKERTNQAIRSIGFKHTIKETANITYELFRLKWRRIRFVFHGLIALIFISEP